MLLYFWHVPLVAGFEVVSLKEVETTVFCPAEYQSVTVAVSVTARLLVRQLLAIYSRPSIITPGRSHFSGTFC
jgi:hypothetical protein